MKQRISRLPSPALAGVIKEKSVPAAIAAIRNCRYDGATMVDLHLSCLCSADRESLEKIIGSAKLPVLALNYNNAYEGGDAGFSEEERVESLLRAVRAGAAGIDMQGYTFDPGSKSGYFGEKGYSFAAREPKEVVTDEKIVMKQCALIEEVHSLGSEVLLSCHPGVRMNAGEVVELALFLEKRKPDIIKIVTVAEDEDDLIESFRAMLALKREVETPVAYHAGGRAGLLSRVINPVLGGHIAFCVDRYDEGSFPEQPGLSAVRAAVDNLKKIL